MIWSIFSCINLSSVIFFGEMSVKVFGPFFNSGFFYCWVLSVLCIFWIIVFYQKCLANIFFQSVTCLLIPLILSFAEYKFLILINSSLSIISFMYCVFTVVPKKSSLYPRSSRSSPILSSRSFVVLHFTFRLKVHFKLTYVKSVRSVSRLIFLACGCPVVLAPFVEESVFASLYCLCSFIIGQLTTYFRSISGLSILLHWSMCQFFC